MAWDTAANILNDAAAELGLLTTDLADPYASTDQSIIQLCRFLKGVGQALVDEYDWPHLQKTRTISTVNGVVNYELATDFSHWVDETAWNQATTLPLVGGVSGAVWRYVDATSATGSAYQLFRRAMSVATEEIAIYPTPPGEEDIEYEYVSRYWVGSEGSAPTAAAPTLGIDVCYLDRLLLIAAIKLRWREAKGFDTTADERIYLKALERAKSKATSAPVLSLSPSGGEHLIDACNVPDTGYGD